MVRKHWNTSALCWEWHFSWTVGKKDIFRRATVTHSYTSLQHGGGVGGHGRLIPSQSLRPPGLITGVYWMKGIRSLLSLSPSCSSSSSPASLVSVLSLAICINSTYPLTQTATQQSTIHPSFFLSFSLELQMINIYT